MKCPPWDDEVGAAGGIRTPDPLFRRQMLYPLSYSRAEETRLYPSEQIAQCISQVVELKRESRIESRARLNTLAVQEQRRVGGAE